MSDIKPFKVDIPQNKLESIRARVEAFEWFSPPAGLSEWQLGMSTPVLKDIQSYWLNAFDWRAAEAKAQRIPAIRR